MHPLSNDPRSNCWRTVMARIAPLALALSALILPGTVLAARPATEVIAVDETFVGVRLTDACGFEVVRHVAGSFTIRSFSDGTGTPAFEITMARLTDTLTANGNVVVGHSAFIAHQVLLGDGSTISATTGRDYLDRVGLVIVLFDANGDPVATLREAGQPPDLSTICAGLA